MRPVSYTQLDRKAIEVCRSRGYRFPRVTGWIRANMDDLKIAHDMEFDEVGLLTSMSDYHIFLKLGKTREQAMNDYLKVVTKALEWGIVPRCHFEDVTRADIYGFCLPFARKLMELSHEASMPIKIRLCDTMGSVSYTHLVEDGALGFVHRQDKLRRDLQRFVDVRRFK